jgi:Phosphorylase superfamily.
MSQPASAPSPNARLVPEQLRPDVILCCGEEKRAFVDALHQLGLEIDATAPDFRGYTVWTLPKLTLVLAPIGTGAVEPILCELLAPGRVERIVLVGTAGRLSARPLPLGTGFPIVEARLAGTGLDREVSGQPLRPEWPVLPPGPTASIVSSDLYYGFSPARRPGDYRHRLPALRRDFERLSGVVDLVDMEVGQFYALCRLIPDTPGLRFLAIKGASNGVENHAEQNTHAPAVLLDCLRQALALLGRR